MAYPRVLLTKALREAPLCTSGAAWARADLPGPRRDDDATRHRWPAGSRTRARAVQRGSSGRWQAAALPLRSARGALGPTGWACCCIQCMPDAGATSAEHAAMEVQHAQLQHQPLVHTPASAAAPAAAAVAAPVTQPVGSRATSSHSKAKRVGGFFSRLLTHLDPLRLHAISGALYLVFSTIAVLHILGHTLLYGVNPNPLHDMLIPALFFTSLVMNCTGFQMAVKHCRGEHLPAHSLTPWGLLTCQR